MISIIAAMDDDRGIGKKNDLLFRISEDLARFKKLTMKHPIIMGRKTHESIGRVLPDRTNIIISRDEQYRATGCVVCHTLEGAIDYAKQEETAEIFVIGGAKVFAQAIDIADRLYLTIVRGTYGADVFFPEYESEFTVLSKSSEQSEGEYRYRFVDLRRIS